MDMGFLQKNASKLVKFGLGSSISDLHPPIGGHHPVLYFPTQITKKYSTAMCYTHRCKCVFIIVYMKGSKQGRKLGRCDTAIAISGI